MEKERPKVKDVSQAIAGVQMTTIRERVQRVWEVLADPSRGKQAWFAEQVQRLTGWPVSEPTVHRWIYGKTKKVDARCFEAIEALENESLELLTGRIGTVFAGLQSAIRTFDQLEGTSLRASAIAKAEKG